MTTEIAIQLIIRLVVAGVLGSLIGIERELRAKEAGLRTHFLVTLGSALFMIVSQWGFESSAGAPGTRPADAARVAAQIVSGIGFLGAGAIIMQKHSVRGLTTAAGLWVAAAIGMAVGGGLIFLGCVATILALSCLVLFQYLRNLKTQHVTLVFTTQERAHLINVTNTLNNSGYKVIDCSVQSDTAKESELLRVRMQVQTHLNVDKNLLILLIRQYANVWIERIE